MNDVAVAFPSTRRVGAQRKLDTTFSIGRNGQTVFYWEEDLFKSYGFYEGAKVKGRVEGNKVILSLGNQAAPSKMMGQVAILRLPVGSAGRLSTRVLARVSGLLPNVQERGASPVAEAFLTEKGELAFVLPSHVLANKKLKANEDDTQALENAISLVNRAISKGIAKADLYDGKVVLSVTTVRMIGRD